MIRGGYNNRRSVQENARDHHELRGEYALSVFSLADATVEEIAQVAALPNAKIRVTTVGELRAAGFDPVPKGRAGHAHVVLADDKNATIDRFVGCFAPVIDNPALAGDAP